LARAAVAGKTTNATQAGADIVAFSAGTFAFKNISFVRNMAASGGALHQVLDFNVNFIST